MAVERNKIDAIKSLESQGILNSEEARRCIEVLNENCGFTKESGDFEEDLFFAD